MEHKIIAVDFDGTLVTDCYPDIGRPKPEIIAALKREKSRGARTILYTCRNGTELSAALLFCEEAGLTFDAVNENLPELIEKYGGDTRKISADEYWDDRNVWLPSLENPALACGTLTGGRA